MPRPRSYRKRTNRILVMLSDEEYAALDDWRRRRKISTRATAIRPLFQESRAAAGYDIQEPFSPPAHHKPKPHLVLDV